MRYVSNIRQKHTIFIVLKAHLLRHTRTHSVSFRSLAHHFHCDLLCYPNQANPLSFLIQLNRDDGAIILKSKNSCMCIAGFQQYWFFHHFQVLLHNSLVMFDVRCLLSHMVLWHRFESR